MEKNFSFGSKVFGDVEMKSRLPKDIYESLRRTIDTGSKLELNVANVVASAMKDWAIDNNATHYCHWFMPLTGGTSEKHDAFISLFGKEDVITEFSGKNLIQGEPDASSFPSGGLRATSEARGYTVWDCTSYAFIKDDSLYIPTAFCSYTGEALDKKTPLLRSMANINKVATDFMHALGYKDVITVTSSVGPEQEYFLIDKQDYAKRMDLRFCGRTLIGKFPPKRQEMEDHYFGNLKQRVSDYMKELDSELWKLGVTAKTKHNETAPSQHELAPIYSKANVATDNNYITMELMRKIADKHNFVCLLHEKPFEGINGSGKHDNWSIITDTGKNLLEPGKEPENNIVFLLTLCAIIESVDKFGDLLRMSVASCGNDRRLGSGEAPPAIISVYLGEYITGILDDILSGKHEVRKANRLKSGVDSLPDFLMDTSDRNRTSPFAFTGNKFEFRMVGSSASIAGPNTVINTIVADSLRGFTARLTSSTDVEKTANEIIKQVLSEHGKIIFNGNNYSKEWAIEAKKRGIPVLSDSVEAFETLKDTKNIDLFVRNNVYSKNELEARYNINLINYINTINIEALTLLEMLTKQVIPFGEKTAHTLAKSLHYLVDVGNDSHEMRIKMTKVLELIESLTLSCEELEKALAIAHAKTDALDKARSYRDKVNKIMDKARVFSDTLEAIVPKHIWDIPSYSDMLYYI